jgi:hypothetical protein
MMPTVRIIGLSLLTAWLRAALASAFFEQPKDIALVRLILGCVGAIVGAAAGAAGEIVVALRRTMPSHEPSNAETIRTS